MGQAPNLTRIPAGVQNAALQTARPLSQARHLPAYFYTSPEVFALEKEKIFGRDWMLIGRVEELEQPGSYLTFKIAGEPILVCRTQAGELKAFSNVCRHRGTQVAFGQPDSSAAFCAGNARSFSCPYHGWTYDLTGKLVGAPHTQSMEGFERANYSLVPLKLDTWAGFLFVNLDSSARPLADTLEEMDFLKTYEPYHYENFRLGSKFSFSLDCNWKFANENLVDIYHIAVLHVQTFGPWQPLESYEFRPVRGGYHGYFKGGTLAPGGKSLFGTIPWISGKLAEGGYSSHLRPNVAWFPRHDFHCVMSVWPGSTPEKTVGISYQLFPKQHLELPDFKERVRSYDDFLKEFLGEDITMITALQQGVSSRYYAPGPMSSYEVAIHSLANYYLECLER
jgi:choline monooxygenase